MNQTKLEQEEQMARARNWVAKDRCDLHRQYCLDAALDLGTQDAWEKLEMEMHRNP
ncbi:MAG: hypothetical protein K0B00_02750 [Rhodobacteraceae bacterium]|nr:hypothetical protein [Paracoccaceae bacterium]